MRMDLINLMRKYAGETERNLTKLLAAQDAKDVAVFLDEAHALSGRQGEVTDLNDRHANHANDYLSISIERRERPEILATNSRTALEATAGFGVHAVLKHRAGPLPGPRDFG